MWTLLAACTLGLDPYGDTDSLGDTDVVDSDAPDDTDEDTSDDTSDPDATGLTGGLVEMSRLQIACPSCFGVTSELSITASAAFHEPTAKSWLSGYPDSGGCALNRVADPPTTARIDHGDWAYLESGSTSIGLRRTVADAGVFYSAEGIGEADFRTTASYALSVPEAGVDVANAVTTPQGFVTIEPVGILYTTPSSAFTQPIRAFGQNPFTWSNSGGSGDFIVQIEVYDPYGAYYLGSLACRGPDNGSMNVPGSMLASFPDYSLLAVYVYRLEVGGFVLETNGSTVETTAIVGVIGTAYLSP